ncbi:hypothetical protein [Helicobacter brantae]|uniref:Uncharacterized protein n=1 Tax=Helicobacter brantae TaxID=375927 RepID=A0A3D8J5D6_9HELI|nr:hypothetical protein [Helicobacter brantae]RDU72114.1 hypothetical protein CQA58_00475 [Helicobacter brantae]
MKKSSLIFALSLWLWGSEMEFIISYKAKMQDDILVGEDYKVSEVIDSKGIRGIKDGDYQLFKICNIIPRDYEGVEDEASFIKKVLKTQRELVLDCLYSSGVKIYDEVTSKDLQAKSRTIFSIPPKRVIAKYENGVVNLGILEEKKK